MPPHQLYKLETKGIANNFKNREEKLKSSATGFYIIEKSANYEKKNKRQLTNITTLTFVGIAFLLLFPMLKIYVVHEVFL
jgi:hypothetical protein